MFSIASVLLALWAGALASATPDARRGITVDDLLSIRDIKTMTVSPDGNYVAYQVVQADKGRNDYNIGWYVATTKPNASPIMVAEGGAAALGLLSSGIPVGDDIAPSTILWSPDSQWIFFTKNMGGEVQLWRSHRGRFGQEQVTHNEADVTSPKFSKAGSMLLFTVGRKRTDVEEMNHKDARQGYLVQEPAIYSISYGPIWPLCSDGQERWGVESNKNRACTLTVWTLDIETGIEREATGNEIEDYYSGNDVFYLTAGKLRNQTRSMEALSPDRDRLAWFENDDPTIFKGYFPPMRVTVSYENQFFRCPVDACKSTRPEELWWSADGEEVIFLARNGPHNTLSSLYGWVPGDTGVRTILSSDDMFYDCDLVADHLVCGHETWTSPRKIVSVDLHDGEITTIANMNSEFQHFSFTKIEKIIGEDDYGNKAHAHLVYPRDYEKGQQYPLVIVQYRSSGFLRGGVGDEQPIHVLAQNGFAVLSFDSPSVGDYLEKETDQLALQIQNLKYLMIDRGPATAIERMVAGLVKRGIISLNRVGITGLSRGATTLDTALLTRNYAAASTAYSVMAPPNFSVSSASLWGKAMDGAFGGSPYSPKGFETRARHSIGVNAHRINTPCLIQVADREYYVTLQNYNALKAAGKPVEMIVYSNEQHIKWQPAHRSAVYARNIDWFNFWLRGVEDPDPAKVGQYERWRKLRGQHHANLQTLLSK